MEPNTDKNITKIKDIDIGRAIEHQMKIQKGISDHLIDVIVDEGIVTLQGSVDSLLSKKRAEEICMVVRGVRAVINNLIVNAYDIPDKDLLSDVKEALLRDPATESFELNLEVESGKVKVTGTVKSWKERQLVNFVIEGIRGVREVNNELEFSDEEERTDDEMKEDIRQALRWDIRVDDGLIVIDVNDGHAELSGIVGSLSEKTKAEGLAWQCGIKTLKSDELNVERWARDEDLRKDKFVTKSDDEIRVAVQDAFFRDPRVGSFLINVTVERGEVHLEGNVDNLKSKVAAEEDAAHVVGVYFVKNNLKVRPKEQVNDKQIEHEVRKALSLNPYVERLNLKVDAYNGKVYLSGFAASTFEKDEAEETASKVKGVVDTENNINVYSAMSKQEKSYQFDPYTHLNVPGKSDDQIKEDFNNLIWWSPFVNDDKINAEVSDAELVISGSVDSMREKYIADICGYQSGAEKVKNQIVVETS
jgi:osmotically-inducible protein OsmY